MRRRSTLLLALAVGCARSAEPTEAKADAAPAEAGDTGLGRGPLADAAPVTLRGVRLRLRWAPGAATFDDDGARFTTDRGYGVHLVEGYLVSAHATLVPCAQADAASRTAPSRSLAGPGPTVPTAPSPAAGDAQPLGHGTFDDPSAVITAVAEPLHENNPQGIIFGESTFDATEYCGAHYLVATDLNGTGLIPVGPWPPAPEADTAEPQLAERWSLRLRGELTAPDGARSPLLVEAAGATGELWALSELEGADACGELAELLIERRLDTLLDGLDLSVEPPEAIAAGLLVNLIADAEARLQPQGAGP